MPRHFPADASCIESPLPPASPAIKPLGSKRRSLIRGPLLAIVVIVICWFGCLPGGSTAAAQEAAKKQVLMIAGAPSHGFGSHEHYAGLRILADTLTSGDDRLNVQVVRGWPEDPQTIESADSIVIYSDGGGRHPALPHLEMLGQRVAAGCGLVCLHYAVEVPPGDAGQAWLNYLGGYFETNWSVNPHWLARFEQLPDHPITRGVEPFEQQDEWYFHMRFPEPPADVTPILAAVAPESTMRRPDGPHSGNPAVRKSVAAGDSQTVAWAFERPDGGRSFGYTGGHFHWNWGNANSRKLVANAILWSTGLDVPDQGVDAAPLGVQELLKDQDFPTPERFDPEETAEQYDLKASVTAPPAISTSGQETLVSDRSAASGSDAPQSPRHPDNAIAGLEVAEGLELTLAASEPNVRNLTNLDIDDRGRVWVCDVMNYRQNNGSRPEGDRILVMEDTTGDGVMDDVKTFYQGNDINSAMGICVLDNEVIVSAAPYVLRLIDDNGDDVADRKVAMFTQTGQPQHDHSNHSFIFGPDGKLYWNFGNTGQHVKDAAGETVIDIHGRPVVDNGKPFFGGMVFRCDLDGGNFEVIAHNFRNNWETAIDSFGALWQSDNDDDGHRGTRINFVMEHGNYGYRDEMTGANWQAHRINLEPEIPLRHWHLNDPGVVPNLLQTGAGSPSGMTIYEGRLLPTRFHNEMVHCDPGPGVVRAYPVSADGAGYSATIEPLVTASTDNWFRPVDVCVAPDGSIFMTDWYDPGVGGHHQGDLKRGRLYRIAPPGTGYQVPTFDYSTAENATAALRSPTMAVRYKAWMALHAMGKDAEPALQSLYADPDPRLRARALWLLGKISGRAEHYVRTALADDDADIRMTAIRLLRQTDLVPAELLSTIDQDPSPAVRREALVALRYDASEAMPALWARLAARHDGEDRWYLEALGIGSDIRPDECYQALHQLLGDGRAHPAKLDVLWRLRSSAAIEPLVRTIVDPRRELSETDRFFRALDFHDPEPRSRWLAEIIVNGNFATSAEDAGMRSRNDAILVRALQRMKDAAEVQDKQVLAAVNRHIEDQRGTPEYLRLVKRFPSATTPSGLMEVALATGDDSASVEAVRLLLELKAGPDKLVSYIREDTDGRAARLSTLLGLLGNREAIGMLTDWASDSEIAYPIRSAAVRGLSASEGGALKLLELAAEKSLVADCRLLAGGLLSQNRNADIRQRAAEVLPLPVQADSKPLPPIDELVKSTGDVERGERLFRTTATCANCHVVKGFGKQVGPDLSEIGSKLSAEAMYTSILDPSAAISHNYESYLALTDAGQVINGVLVSKTDSAVILRTPEAIDRTIAMDDLVELKKGDKSIMPDDLHLTIGNQGLIDVVHYMMSLRKTD